MENINMGVDKRDNLINELLQGIGFAKELRNHFMNPTNPNPLSSLSNDDLASNYILLEKLLSIFDKTISMAKLLHIHQDHPSINLDNNYSQVGSPHSLTVSSPKSENSHPNFPPSKRRKSMIPKWSKTVKISNDGGVTAGLEGSLNDGFSWRKYGQKAILDAKFPRCYYRCTHRHNQGCGATKHVQRSDEDPTIYQIMYIGEHTCTQGTQAKPNIPAQINSNPQPPPSPEQQEVYVGLSPDGDIKIEPEQELDDAAQIFRSFSFNQAHQFEPIDDNYMLGFYPTFSRLAVETSEANINNGGSGLNSDTNSPVMGGGDFEFSLGELLNFEDKIPFDFGLLS